jgi:hypothetical protein
MPPPRSVAEALALAQRVDERAEDALRAAVRHRSSSSKKAAAAESPGRPRPAHHHTPTHRHDTAEERDGHSEAGFSLYTASEDGAAPERRDVAEAQREMDRITGLVSSLLSGTDSEGEEAGSRRTASEGSAASVAEALRALQHENQALRAENARLRKGRGPASPGTSADERKGTDWRKKAEGLEKTLAAREKHFNACISTINCLIAELKEVFEIRGFAAPGEVERTHGDSVVSQVGRRTHKHTRHTHARAHTQHKHPELHSSSKTYAGWSSRCASRRTGL